MERKLKYEKPNIDLGALLDDVIRTSPMTDGGTGSGGSITYPTSVTSDEGF